MKFRALRLSIRSAKGFDDTKTSAFTYGADAGRLGEHQRVATCPELKPQSRNGNKTRTLHTKAPINIYV